MVGPDIPRVHGTKDLIDVVIEHIQRCRLFSELRRFVYDEFERFGLLVVASSEGLFSRKIWKENNK